jgi:hypothetical protein
VCATARGGSFSFLGLAESRELRLMFVPIFRVQQAPSHREAPVAATQAREPRGAPARAPARPPRGRPGQRGCIGNRLSLAQAGLGTRTSTHSLGSAAATAAAPRTALRNRRSAIFPTCPSPRPHHAPSWVSHAPTPFSHAPLSQLRVSQPRPASTFHAP